MLNKNQIYEAVITDYTSEGLGVAHIEGCAVFIPNAICGEKVTVREKLSVFGSLTEHKDAAEELFDKLKRNLRM